VWTTSNTHTVKDIQIVLLVANPNVVSIDNNPYWENASGPSHSCNLQQSFLGSVRVTE